MRVVWVLGSGFSRPLGGPMLDDLLSTGRQPSVAEAMQRAAARLELSAAETITRLQSVPGCAAGPGAAWSNAEEFISMIDGAVEHRDELAARLIERKLRPAQQGQLALLRRDVLLYVAAHCHAFIVAPEEAKLFEKWGPHRRWAGLLAPDAR